MPKLPRLSARLHGGQTPQQCVEQACAAESAGLSGVWFAENPFSRGIVPAATICAVATYRLAIGVGVFNPYSRHPVQIAMDAGALDELSGGRVRLGLGSGIGSAIERMGFAYDRPLTVLREAVTIIRALLRGEEVTCAGSVFKLHKAKLDYRPRPDIAIFMAARGERSLAVCGELADGLIVSNMCTVGFVAKAVEILHDAARTAGRPRPPQVVQYLPCVARADREEAHRLAKDAVGDMLPAYWTLGQRLSAARQALLDGSDILAAEFEDAVARLAAGESAQAVLDERFVRAFAIAGTAQDCRAQAAAYAAAGVTELALTFFGSQAAADISALPQALSS